MAAANRLQAEAVPEASALTMALAAEDVGVATLGKLRAQTEQMHRIGDDVAATDGVLTSAAKTILSMKSLPARLATWFSPKTPTQAPREARPGEKPSSPKKTRTTEGEERLEALSRSIRNLHGIAKDMGSELATQDKLLDDLGNDMTSLDARLRTQIRDVRALI